MNARGRFTDAIGAAITDIRQRVVEEGWLGRIVTPRALASSDHDTGRASFADSLGWERPAGRDGPEHGIDH